MTSANSVHEAGHPKLVPWDNPEGWGEEEGGRGFRMVGNVDTHADSCLCMETLPQYCKVISLQLK